MPYAVTLCLDSAGAAPIEAMWHALGDAGIDSDRRDLGYAPHITLAVYADDVPVDTLRAALQGLAHHSSALRVRFVGLGKFTSPAAILWAAPVTTAALLDYQAALQAALPTLQPLPHYRVTEWVPHVTLSGALRDPAAAVAALLPQWRPIDALLNRLELVRFRPVNILCSLPLTA